MPITTYNCTDLTGGGARALDAISIDDLSDGNRALVAMTGDLFRYFEFQASATDAESTTFPAKIRPDDYASSGVWYEQSPQSTFTEVVDDTTPELGGELDCGAHSIGFTQQSYTATGAGTTVDWRLGNKAKVTLQANETLTFTAPSNPGNLLLLLLQDATGSRTVTFPGTVIWQDATAPTLTTDGGGVDIISMYYDGTSYYAQAALGWAAP